MTSPASLWMTKLDKKKTTTIFSVPDGERHQLVLKQASLGEAPATTKKQKSSGKTVLYCTIDAPDGMGKSEGGRSKFTTVLCTLTPGKCEQSLLHLIFNATATFSIDGPGPVHIGGELVDLAKMEKMGY
eukprot:gene8349-34937_t